MYSGSVCQLLGYWPSQSRVAHGIVQLSKYVKSQFLVKPCEHFVEYDIYRWWKTRIFYTRTATCRSNGFLQPHSSYTPLYYSKLYVTWFIIIFYFKFYLFIFYFMIIKDFVKECVTMDGMIFSKIILWHLYSQTKEGSNLPSTRSNSRNRKESRCSFMVTAWSEFLPLRRCHIIVLWYLSSASPSDEVAPWLMSASFY